MRRCEHCGEVVAEEAAQPVAVPVRALCPECTPDELAELLGPRGQLELLAVAARCPRCGREGTLRPATGPEARTYEACRDEGYSPDMCAQAVKVRYALGE